MLCIKISSLRKAILCIAFLFLSYEKGASFTTDTSFLELTIKRIEKDKEIISDKEQALLIQKTKEAAEYFISLKKYKRINRCYRAIDLLTPNRNTIKEKFELFKFLNNLVPPSERLQKNLAYHYEGFAMLKAGFVHSAHFTFQKVEKEYLELKIKDKLVNLYNSYSITNIQLRDYINAANFAKKGMLYNPTEDNYYQLQQQLALSYLYSGQTTKSLNEIDKNEDLWNKSNFLKDKRSHHQGQHHFWRSEAYTMDDDLHCANLYADSCIMLCKKANPDFLIYAYKQKGIVLSKMGRQREAIQFFQKFIKGQANVGDVRELAKNYLPLGTAYRLDGQYDAAITTLNKGLGLVSPSFIAQANKQINSKVKPTADMYYIDFLDEKAQCYLAMYSKSKNIEHLYSANRLLDTCTAFVTEMKLFYNNFQAKFDLSKESKPIFGRSFETKIKLYELTKKKSFLEAAYKTKQDFSSFYLKEQVSEKDMLSKTIKSPKLIDRYYSLKNSYLESIVESDVFNTPENQEVYATRRLRYEAYVDSLKLVFPSFRNFKKEYLSIGVNDVKQNLKPDEMMISYFISGDNIYSFYVSRADFGYVSSPLDDTIKMAAMQYLSILSTQAYNKNDKDVAEQQYINVANTLYNRLLSRIPNLASAKSLTIVPDGFLYKLPFDSFITKKTNSWNDASSFLISKYDIRYLYYIEQLVTKTDIDLNKRFLGLGLEYDKYTLESFMEMKKDSIPAWMFDQMRSSSSMSQLPFADDEVIAIAKEIPGRYYVNLDATKDKLISKGQDHGIIHISAHSIVDYDEADKSSIIFTKKDSLTNNLLDIGDITNLNLRTQLVTLSSCNSASGRIFDGEGVSSLSKAFFEAGSHSVIGSCWSVSDQVTMLFMKSFYKKLSNKEDLSSALRQTKLSMIDPNNTDINPAYKIPGYWAAWVLYGDTEPIVMANPWTNWIYVALGLLVSGLLFWMFRSSKSLTLQ